MWKKWMACMLVVTMLLPVGIQIFAGQKSSKTNIRKTKNKYIVLSENKEQFKEVNRRFESFGDEYIENLKKKNISYNEMTEKEAEELKKNSDIISVEENIELHGNDGQVAPKDVAADWNLGMIHGENVDTSVREKVRVAVIDSGIDECEGLEVKERYNLVPSENDVLPVYDDITGHGTAVASVIAGEEVKGRGTVGINKNVELYSIKVMDGDNTAPLTRIVEGIYKAIEYKVDIINMSFGTTVNSKILHQAVSDAYNAGILMVAAAGNRGESDQKVEYPAAYEGVMAVGAVNACADISSLSSTGKQIDVMAPGELVRTVTNFGMETVSSGTSIAAPHVTGAASVLWQKDKSKSVDFIRGLLEESSRKVTENGKDYAIIDLEYALNKYKEYEKNYKSKSYEMKDNVGQIQICDKMEKVAARWSKNCHEALVSNNKNGNLTSEELKWIKAGIRYNDVNLSITNKPNRRVWHSLTGGGITPNYMSAMYLVGKVIKAQKCNTAAYQIGKNDTAAQIKKKLIPGLTSDQQKQMVADMNAISVTKIEKIGLLGNKPVLNEKNKKLLLLGIELHIITDAFAHRAYKKMPYRPGNDWNDWVKIGKEGGGETDDTTNVPSRYKAAGVVVKNVINQCLNFKKGKVVIGDTYTIKSKQIMYKNGYFDGSFLLSRLVFEAEVNKANDKTFDDWKGELAGNTYCKGKERERIPEFK